MADYKVRIGDETFGVDGLAGLIRLAKEGRLGPEDPVFIPRTGKWHYARAIRQLREHFPAPAPPAAPAPSEERGVSRPDFTPRPAPVPPQATSPSAAQQAAAAQVVPLRRRRPENAEPIDLPVFTYDVDAEAPKWFRRLVLVGVVLASAAAAAAYVFTMRLGVDEAMEEARLAREAATPKPSAIEPGPQPTRARHRPRNHAEVEVTPPPNVVTGATVDDRQRPVNTRALRKEVNSLPVPLKPDNIEKLVEYIETDMARLKVPVRSIRVEAGKATRKKKVVPYTVRVLYADDPEDGNRRRAAIGMIIGRWMKRTRLNVGTLLLTGHRDGAVVRRHSTTGAAARSVFLTAPAGRFVAGLKDLDRKPKPKKKTVVKKKKRPRKKKTRRRRPRKR